MEQTAELSIAEPVTREPHREFLLKLLKKYIRGITHMHTRGDNPEGGLEATLTLEEQMAYLRLLAQEKPEGSKPKDAYPLEYTTVTNHAEHLGLSEEELTKWIREGRLTENQANLIRSGREKRKIKRGDKRVPAGTIGDDGWGMCTPEENEAMALAAALALQDTILLISAVQENYPEIKIYSGVEASVTYDGRLTILDKDTLQRLDVVIAGPHGAGFDHRELAATPEELIRKYTQLIENYPVLIISHPLKVGSIPEMLSKRLTDAGFSRNQPIDTKTKIAIAQLEPILGPFFDTLAQNGVAFEFNLKSPLPPELTEALLPLLLRHQVPLAIGIDGHQLGELQLSKEELGKMSDQDKIAMDQLLKEKKAIGVKLPLQLARLLTLFEQYGITPQQVITSSKENLDKAIEKRRNIYSRHRTTA